VLECQMTIPWKVCSDLMDVFPCLYLTKARLYRQVQSDIYLVWLIVNTGRPSTMANIHFRTHP
jgi:hypothetical protein